MLSGQGLVRRIGMPPDWPLRARRICRPSTCAVATWPMSGRLVLIGWSLRVRSVWSVLLRTLLPATLTSALYRPVRDGTHVLPQSRSLIASHLCEAAIHEQFRSRDVARVVGREKHHGPRDLIGRAKSAQRNTAGNEFHAFLGPSYGVPWGGVGIARAHRVHANSASLQVRCPCPRERTDRSFGGAINTPVWQPFTADDGRIQDDRRAVRHEDQRFLHGEEQALHIGVEDRVILLFSDRAQRGKRKRPAGIGEDHVKPALLPLDLREEAIEIVKL